MAEVVRCPSAIHTAFNPVILQLKAVNGETSEECVLESGSRSVAVRREFFNGETKFDLSDILKYWFEEGTEAISKSEHCFVDRRLTFEYDYGYGSAYAVNAVVQLGRNPNMLTWGNRLLTHFPVLKKYEGYPLDVSYLSNGRNAVVYFDWVREHEGSINKPHFSIDIPDGVGLVEVVNVPIVALGNNSGENILDNGGRKIMVVNPRGTVRVERALLDSCVPSNPFYVRWINPLGGFDYWMFYQNQLYGRKVKTLTTMMPAIDDIERARYVEREVDKEVDNSVFVGAGNLTDREYEALLTVATAPLVEWWDRELETWIRIYVASGDFENGTWDTKKEIELEFTLPVQQTQF
jgi:hypothetical protein